MIGEPLIAGEENVWGRRLSHEVALPHVRGPREQAASRETPNEGEGEPERVDWQEKYLDKLDRDMSEIRDSLRHMAGHVEQVVDSLRGEITSLRSEVKSEIDTLRSEVKSEVDTLRFEVKSQVDTLRSEVKSEISGLRSELRGEIGDLRSGLGGDIGDLRKEVRGINKWVIGLVVSAIAGITAIAVSTIALVATAISRMS